MHVSTPFGLSMVLMAPLVAAYWRMQCDGVTAIAQIDPLAEPNIMSQHAHTIKGGSGMHINASAEDLLNSQCTSCQVQQDKSAYWTPQLYFMHANGGKAELVPEVKGHITYYKYTPVYHHNGTLMYPEALPNGLRVISGNKMRRNFTLAVPDPARPWSGGDATQDALAMKAVGFNCLNYGRKPEDSLFRHFLPDKAQLEGSCVDGIRAEMLFPQCWNGQLDSADHQSHMAFADQGINGGRCPPGFDHNLMQIFYETIWPTGLHKADAGHYAFSNGDPTGYGYHADLMVAWDAGVLQQALAACGSDTTGAGTSGVTSACPVFKLNSPDAMGKCKLAASNLPGGVDLAKSTMLPALPGDNPVQSGPAQATKPAASQATKPASAETTKPAAPAPTPSHSQAAANVLLAQQQQPTASSPSSAAAAPTTMVKSTSAAAAVAPPVQSPSTTAAPTAGPAPVHQALTTLVFTTNGAVVNEVLVQDEVVVTVQDTVTVVVPAPLRKRLDAHRHAHAHGRRGGNF